MAGHEHQDVSFQQVILTGAGIFGLIALALILSWLTYRAWRSFAIAPEARPETFTTPSALPPAPRLQRSPATDLERLRSSEDSVLLSYGWVSRDSGLVRIPVARAMEILAEKGFPVERETGTTKGEQ